MGPARQRSMRRHRLEALVGIGARRIEPAIDRIRRAEIGAPADGRQARRERGVPGELGEPIDLVVIDASFIGLGKLLPAARDVLRPGGEIVAMVKPQFEVDRRDLRKGVVRDPEARAAAIAKVEAEARELGLEVLGRCDSQLPGPEGNVEAFLRLRRP